MFYTRRMAKNGQPNRPSRRDFLKTIGLGAGAALLSGCTPGPLQAAAGGPSHTSGGDAAAPTPADELPSPVPSATRTPFAPSTLTPTPEPTATITAGPTPTRTPDPRKLCFVLWDHQLARYNYKPRNTVTPVPETCPLYSGAINLITNEWMEYWKAILHVCNPEVGPQEFQGAWDSLVAPNRAFTNGTGPRSAIFAIHTLTCGGATHEMVTGIAEGDYMRIYTLNGRKPPPPIPTKIEDIDITRHFFATTGSNVKLPDGSYAVYGFPQFENCIIPLVSPEDTDLILLDRIKVVTNIERPYNTG